MDTFNISIDILIFATSRYSSTKVAEYLTELGYYGGTEFSQTFEDQHSLGHGKKSLIAQGATSTN